MTRENQAYALEVNYGLSLPEALKVGDYDSVDPYLTSECFPPTDSSGTEIVEVRLVPIKPLIDVVDGIPEELQGLHPGIKELDRQRTYVQQPSRNSSP